MSYLFHPSRSLTISLSCISSSSVALKLLADNSSSNLSDVTGLISPSTVVQGNEQKIPSGTPYNFPFALRPTACQSTLPLSQSLMCNIAAFAVDAAALNFLSLITSKNLCLTRGAISSLIQDFSTKLSMGMWLMEVRLVSMNIVLDVLPQTASFLT